MNRGVRTLTKLHEAAEIVVKASLYNRIEAKQPIDTARTR